MKTGLVLEGGGMRGLYTIGVLDFFMDKGITADYVIGVSAGACNGASFVSKQKGRSYHVNMDYLGDDRYVSLKNLIKTKSIFGMDFLFDDIPNRLNVFDYEAFHSSPCEFIAGVTSVSTGKPVYFGKEDMKGYCTVLRASSAIPVFSPMVEYKGEMYLDGGTSDAIPAKKAVEDGCDRLVVVLTRDRGYVKKPESFRALYKRVFKDSPNMIKALDERHEIYNSSLKYVKELEMQGKAIVIAPSKPLKISRFEKNREKLQWLFDLGESDASQVLEEVKAFTGKEA